MKKITQDKRDAIIETIVDRLMSGESLRKICDDSKMPNRRTILEWMNADEGLASTIARARELQADALDDDIADVVADIRSGKIAPDAGRVIIWANQWRASKMKPKRYGDKLQAEVSGTLTMVVQRELPDASK